jgi:outer membrane protein assembly factor BamB
MTTETIKHVRRGLAVLAAVAVTAGLTSAVPAQALATAGSLTAKPTSLIAGEKLVLSGAVSPKLKRTVVLQRKSGTSWVKVAQKSSATNGAFSFSTTGRASTTKYRVYSPAATIGGKRRSAVATPVRTVTTLAQTASLALPTTAGVGDTSTATATFTPVRVGRPVTLQQLEGGDTWTTFDSGVQSSSGKATFPVTLDGTGTFKFRVVTGAWKGAAAKVSATRTLVVSEPGDTTAPGPVTSVTVTGATASSLTIDWTNPSDSDYAGVVIRRAVGSTPPATRSSGTLVADKGPGATQHVDSGLANGTTYSYALFAYDEVPNYAGGATGQGTTLTPADTTPPGPVTTVTVTDASTTSLTIGWTNPGDADYAGVMIRRATGSTPPATTSSGTLVVNKAAPATSHVDTGLNPTTQYSYSLFAYDEVPNHAAKATGQGTTLTPADSTPPGPVTTVTVTGATSSSLTLGWTNPGDADYEGVMIRRATGSTPPATTSSGTLVVNKAAPATSHVDTGLNPSTQYSYSLFAYDEVPNHAAKATGQGTTTAATTSDWAQSRHDPEHRGWSPTETTITTGNAPNVDEEWSVPLGGGTPVIAGGVAYVIGPSPLNGTGLLSAYQLSTGERVWQISTGSCSAGPLAVTTDLVVVSCGSYPRAYARGGGHALVWDTAEAEDGQTPLQYLSVTGDRIVAWGSNRVASYQLSDGGRAWNLLLPSGATSIFDVAVSGSTVVVAYNDRLRALSLTNGSQLWSKPGVTSAQLVIADGWIYTSNNGTAFSRFALADGAAGWSTPSTYGFARVEAVDGDTVYVWDPQFDFGPPAPSVLRALKTSDGTQRWEYDVPSRIGSVGVTGDVLWLTSTDIYSQGRNGDLIALNRATGAELRHLHYDDNIYGWTDIAFGAGKVVLHQGGSFGGSTPHTLRVFGLAGKVPTVTTKVLPIGRVGSAYSSTLESIVGGATWAVQSGSLPNGLSLSGGGSLTGTPTTTGSTRVTLRATAPNGRTADRAFTIQVVPAASTGGWTSTFRDATGNPFDSGTGLLDLEDAPTFSFRWKTAAPGTTVTGGDLDVVASGTRMYGTQWDGFLKAWDTTGSTANRTHVWAVKPDTGNFVRGVTITADRVLVRDDSGYLHARNLTTGAPVWTTADTPGLPYGDDGPLVVGTTVVLRDSANSVRAYSLTTGAPLWGGEPAPVDNVYRALSSDGTRVFAVGECQLYALSLATGDILWQTPMSSDPNDCGLPGTPPGPPIVVGGKVYASESGVWLVADAATGAVQLTRKSAAYYVRSSVVVGGVWVYLEGEEIVAVDTTTGDLLWRIPGDWRGARVSATGDVILVSTSFALYGFSRLTGEQVWDGGSISAVNGSAVIHGNRILMATQDSVRAYGPL